MPRKTSIEISDATEQILHGFEATYGLKNIVAAGILAFSRLSAQERERLIAESNGIRPEDPAELAADHARMCMKTYQGLSARDLAVSLQFLSDAESKAIRQMLQSLSPTAKTRRRLAKKSRPA